MGRVRARSALLALAVAVALADSSVVTLALPDLIRHFDVGITTVAWVLIAYNLVLALAAVPAAHLARRRPVATCAAGLVVFSAASLACGLAPSFPVLIAGRVAQALGAAGVIAGALVLLRTVHESERRAAHVWARAGILGAALGPAVGGVLTQALGWEAIFLVQVPLTLAPVAALVLLVPTAQADESAGRPHLGANLALLLASGALSAALFLLVILLVNGWGLEPARAGAVLTVMPAAAVAAGRLSVHVGGTRLRAATGLVLVAGGLTALGVLPHAGWAWTLPPQLLVGAGLGLTIAALTEQALSGRPRQVVHGGWTIASRHAGVVVGLLVLTPVFTVALQRNEREATRGGTAIVLDSSIPPLQKLRVAQNVLRTIDEADGRLPDVRSAFPDEDGAAGAELARVGDALQAQLEAAVTDAFSRPFLLAAAFALAAVAVVAVTRQVEL